MKLSEFIASKEGYDHLKRQCLKQAFQFQMNYSDILSLAHLRTGSKIDKDDHINDLQHAYCTINVMVKRICISEKRGNLRSANEIYSTKEEMESLSNNISQADYEAKQILEMINSAILKKFASRPRYLTIYNDVLIGGMTFQAASDLHGININSIKTIVGIIRNYALHISKNLS